VDVMRNDKPVSSIRRILARDVAEEEVFRVLDKIGGIHQVILSIQVVVNDVIAEGSHVGLAAGSRVTVGEWWPHVGREEAQDVVERNLVVIHLIEPLLSC